MTAGVGARVKRLGVGACPDSARRFARSFWPVCRGSGLGAGLLGVGAWLRENYGYFSLGIMVVLLPLALHLIEEGSLELWQMI